MAIVETSSWARPAVDLTSCDREPIHLIGAVQPFGFLVALSDTWNVLRASANAADHLGRAVDALLGASFSDVISAEAVHTIRNRLSRLRGPDAVERAFAVQLQDGHGHFDLAVHKSGQTIIIEAEPSRPSGELNAGTMVRSMLDRMQGHASLLHEAVRLVQALTGFDRVMIYRFHPDGSGEVVAERVRAGLDPYLGLHYPADDIPVQARALMLRNPVRVLADVAAVQSPIMLAPGGPDEPLDLSMSILRAHSVMCIEYLQNMGVGATFTLSLVRDGSLWGLVSCHHMTPRHISFEQRTTAELFAQMLSFLIEKREHDALSRYEAHTRRIHDQLIAAVVEKGSTGTSIAALADRLSELVPCDGIGVCVDGHVTLQGMTPTQEEFAALRPVLDRVAGGQVHATDELSSIGASTRDLAGRPAGMLVIPISRLPRDYLVFFRQEMAHAVTWAGKPGKLLETGPNGDRLTPRKSFEAWQQTVQGRSAPWTEAELRAAEAIRITLIEVVLQLTGTTETERSAAAQKQELLIAELNHRVRNILGLIRGLVTQSRTSAVDVDSFATVLGDRVHALARAHDQITAKNWGPGSLASLIVTEVGAYLGGDAVRIHASGPAVLLQPQAFSTMALVIHELMTNAAKYGALLDGGQPGKHGQVKIQWSLNPDGDVVLTWSEIGGPQVRAPARRGFGVTIIERSIPHELGGDATLDYAPAGVQARFRVPARHAVIGEAADVDPAARQGAVVASPGRLSGTVLLVEDNMIIALNAEDILLALGAERVVVASNVQEALQQIERQTPDFALLDINLGSELIWPVATRLRELQVRHVFATGYGDGDGFNYPLESRSTPSVTKPYSSDSIARAVGKVLSVAPGP